MKKYFLIFLLFFYSSSFSQAQYEFLGVLKLNGNDKTIISYRLVFNVKDGKISGYSITGLDGAHETKNSVYGTFDLSKKNINFYESNILYTKSKISTSSFCYVNFQGKINLDNTNAKLEGAFKGQFKNKVKCIDGTLSLVSLKKIEKTVSKLSKKMEKTKRISKEVKEKYNPTLMLDSLKINKLNKDENLNVFWNSNKVIMNVWDTGIQDGDIIDIYHNNKIILKNYTISSKKRTIVVELSDGENIFKIIALNEGEVAPNTSKISLEDSGRFFELMANLKKDEQTQITIVRE